METAPLSNVPEPLVALSCAQAAELLAAAAVDAIDADDERSLQRHLTGCVACQQDLEVLRAAAAVLALNVAAAEPPPALRARIMATVRSEPRRRWPIPLSGRTRVRRPGPAWAAVAACAVVAVGSLAWAGSLQQQLNLQRAQIAELGGKADRYDRVVAVLESTALTLRPLEPSVSNVAASGTIFMDPTSGTGMVMVHNLPTLATGRVWQLWYVRNGERVSGGVLRTDETGTGYTLIRCPKDLQQFESIGVTEEPAGGSPAPTSPRVIEARI